MPPAEPFPLGAHGSSGVGYRAEPSSGVAFQPSSIRRDMESMEQEKARHYVAQMALSERQLAILSHDVVSMQEELDRLWRAVEGREPGFLETEVGDLSRDYLSLRDAVERCSAATERIEAAHSALGGSSLEHVSDLRRALNSLSEDFASLRRSFDQVSSLPQRVAKLEEGPTASCASWEERMVRLESLLAEDVLQSRATHASLVERVACLERELEEAARRHAKLIEAHDKVRDSTARHAETLGERMAAQDVIEQRVLCLERTLGDFSGRPTSLLEQHERLRESVEAQGECIKGCVDVSSLRERIFCLEGKFGDSAEKHAIFLEGHARVQDAACRRAERLDEGLASVEGRMTHMETVFREVADRQAEASLKERVDNLAKALRDAADDHAKIFREHEKLRDSSDRHSERLDERGVAYTSLEARMSSVEKQLKDSIDEHAELLGWYSQVEASAKELAKEFGESRNLYASVVERVACLEEELEGSMEKHAELLQEHEKVRHCGDRHATRLDESSAAQVALEERMYSVERGLADASEKYASLLENQACARDDANQHATQLNERTEAHASLADRVARLAEGLTQSREGHASLQEQVTYLEREMGPHIQVLREQGELLERHAQDLDKLRVMHNALEDRTARTEKELIETGVRHTKQIQDSTEKLSRCMGEADQRHAMAVKSLREEQERHRGDIGDLQSFQERHTNLSERVTWLEQAAAGAAERYAAETVRLRRLYQEVRGSHEAACLEARVGALERQHSQSARQLDLLADCLQKELRVKSDLLSDSCRSVLLSSSVARRPEEETAVSLAEPDSSLLQSSRGAPRGIWWG